MAPPPVQPVLMFFDKDTDLLALEIPLTQEQAIILQGQRIQEFDNTDSCAPIEGFYMEFLPE